MTNLDIEGVRWVSKHEIYHTPTKSKCAICNTNKKGLRYYELYGIRNAHVECINNYNSTTNDN